MNKLIVTAKSGKTVNLRLKPSKESAILRRVPTNAAIELISKYSDEWYVVKYQDTQGYMMAEFLKTKSSTLSQEDIREVYNSLSETLKLIEKLLK